MGKELIFKSLRHEKTQRVPWVPFAGVHAGQLRGYTAEEMLTNADNIVESLEEVAKLYMPDGMPISGASKTIWNGCAGRAFSRSPLLSGRRDDERSG